MDRVDRGGAFCERHPGSRAGVDSFRETGQPSKSMRIGLYGGTFDPIHHGHLILARDALEQLELDRLILIPNSISPHKLEGTPVDPAQRLAMIREAIAGEEGLECDPVELDRGGTSYTVDTVLSMREKFPSAELHYLVGADNLPELHTWRRIDELTLMVKFVVLLRGAEEVHYPYPTLNRQIEISATDIRERVANQRSIRYLVPDCVRDIIEANALYREVP